MPCRAHRALDQEMRGAGRLRSASAEIISTVERRRLWPDEEKLQTTSEVLAPGAAVAAVGRLAAWKCRYGRAGSRSLSRPVWPGWVLSRRREGPHKATIPSGLAGRAVHPMYLVRASCVALAAAFPRKGLAPTLSHHTATLQLSCS
jgi:hypothetical protein